MEGFYEFDSLTNISPTGFAESFNEEQNVYDAPYDVPNGKVNYGPFYIEPPDEVEKIFESIDGKKIYKLHREDVRYDAGSTNRAYYKHFKVSGQIS